MARRSRQFAELSEGGGGGGMGMLPCPFSCRMNHQQNGVGKKNVIPLGWDKMAAFHSLRHRGTGSWYVPDCSCRLKDSVVCGQCDVRWSPGLEDVHQLVVLIQNFLQRYAQAQGYPLQQLLVLPMIIRRQEDWGNQCISGRGGGSWQSWQNQWDQLPFYVCLWVQAEWFQHRHSVGCEACDCGYRGLYGFQGSQCAHGVWSWGTTDPKDMCIKLAVPKHPAWCSGHAGESELRLDVGENGGSSASCCSPKKSQVEAEPSVWAVLQSPGMISSPG